MLPEAAIREIREKAQAAYGSLVGVIEPEQEEILYYYGQRVRGEFSPER
jgi:hypothetical protein